jgi:hypothetical protein
VTSAPPNPDLTSSVISQLTMSFAGAAEVATQFPEYATQITTAAKAAFLDGDQWAYLAGIVAVLIGAALVYLKFPTRDEEERLLADYHATDAKALAAATALAPDPTAPQAAARG